MRKLFIAGQSLKDYANKLFGFEISFNYGQVNETNYGF